jgi:type II secretory pathway pseudopilin PulG
MTLIEAMAAMAVFSFGVVGVFQGVIVASRQNATANKMTVASAIAQQTRSALSARGRTALTSPGGLLTDGNCSADADVVALAGGLETIAGACVIDLDAVDGAAAAANQLVPAYPAAYRFTYRRVLVRMPPDPTGRMSAVAAVVSFPQLGRRQFQKQVATLYNVGAAGQELNF